MTTRLADLPQDDRSAVRALVADLVVRMMDRGIDLHDISDLVEQYVNDIAMPTCAMIEQATAPTSQALH